MYGEFFLALSKAKAVTRSTCTVQKGYIHPPAEHVLANVDVSVVLHVLVAAFS